MMALILVLAATGLGPFQASPAVQPPGNQASPPPHPPTHGGDGDWGFVELSPPAVNLAYEREAEALRAEMHDLQKSDGGQLTTQHRAYIHDKAKALLSAYRRDVRLMDASAINADGSRPH
jgi:hypothetical protein